ARFRVIERYAFAFEEFVNLVAVPDLGDELDGMRLAVLAGLLVLALDLVERAGAGFHRDLADLALFDLVFELAVSDFLDVVLLQLAQLEHRADRDDNDNEPHQPNPRRKPRVAAIGGTLKFRQSRLLIFHIIFLLSEERRKLSHASGQCNAEGLHAGMRALPA